MRKAALFSTKGDYGKTNANADHGEDQATGHRFFQKTQLRKAAKTGIAAKIKTTFATLVLLTASTKAGEVEPMAAQ